MENKITKHVSNHRVGYLIAAVLVTVGGFSVASSNIVPKFSTLNNTALTGNVGDLSTVSSQVTLIDDKLASSVVTTGQKVTIEWKSNVNTADLYLLSDDNSLKRPITIKKAVVNNDAVKSFVWEVPANLASGNYSIGLYSGGKLDKTDMGFTLVQTSNKADGGLSALKSQLKTVSTQVEKSQTQLASLNSQITTKNSTLQTLNKEVATVSAKLNTNLSTFQANKAKLSNTAYTQQAKEIYTLNVSVSEKNLAVTKAKAEVASLQAQAKALEARIASDQARISALQLKISEVQGMTNLNLNSSVTATNGINPVTASSLTLNSNGAELKMNSSSLTDLQAAITAKQNTLNELKTQAVTASSEVEAARLEVTNAQKAFDEASNELKKITADLEETTTRRVTLRRITPLVNNTDQASATDSEKELHALQTQEATLQAQLLVAQANVQVTQERLNTGKKINSAKDDAAAQLQVSISLAESELATLKTQYSNLQAVGSGVNQNDSVSNELSNEVNNEAQINMNNEINNNVSSDSDSKVSVTNGLSVTSDAATSQDTSGEMKAASEVISNIQMKSGLTNSVTTNVTAQ